MSLEYSMNIKLLTEYHFEFLSLIGGSKGLLSLHLSKCYIVGNHMSWLVCTLTTCGDPDERPHQDLHCLLQ